MRFWFPDGQLERWACLGAVTDRSVRVWLRDSGGERRVARLVVQGRAAVEMELRPDPAHDHVAAADVALPEPAPGAAFSVEVGGMVRRGQFAPVEGQATAYSFGFGSCHEPFVPGPPGGPVLQVQPRAGIYPPMAEALRTENARFLLLLGDQIYSDSAPWISVRGQVQRATRAPSEEEERTIYRELYRGYFQQSGFRALLEGWPTYMMWDDHDIYDGYGSLLEQEIGPRDQTLFRAADTAFREYQHLHNPGASLADARPYHYYFWYGDTGFFVFDLRSERDYRTGSLLGPRQQADFHAFLAQSDAREAGTLFVGATIPIVHFSPAIASLTEWVPGGEGKGVRDRLTVGGYRLLRDEVLDALLDWQAARPQRQVIVLSGDVHVGAAFLLRRRDGGGVLHQWTSSPLSTSTSALQTVANWLGTRLVSWGEDRYDVRRTSLVLHKGNFGLVRVQPLPAGGHEVTFSLRAFDPRLRRLREAARIVSRPTD